ncbi:MAG: choice-of-anchor Q domain-containing protein [Myxococcales bacterium]
MDGSIKWPTEDDDPSDAGIDAGDDESEVDDWDAAVAQCALGIGCDKCVVYVDARSQCEEGCGASWERAIPTVQAGIDAAKATAPCEVWVASGLYYPSPEGGRDASIVLRTGVAVYGGFAGRERKRKDRDFERNVTILSGDLGVVGDSSDNAYHVVLGADSARIDGFTITGGQADGTAPALQQDYALPFPQASGAGMLNKEVSPEVANCVFTRNWAKSGGAVFNVNSSVAFANTGFVENTSLGTGGAVVNWDGAPVFSKCHFVRNSGEGGGALYNYGCSPRIENSEFRENEASAGGAIANSWATPELKGSSFVSNTARVGGAMQTDYTPGIRIEDCVFVGNASVDNGGALHTTLSPLHIVSSIFVDNRSENFGGAASSEGQDAWLAIVNSTFVNNSARLGGDVAYLNTPDSNNLSISNSILWDNGGRPVMAVYKVPSIRYSDFEGGCSTEADGGGCTTDDTGNIDADPLFADPPERSSDGGVDLQFDVSLLSESPCIDRADPSAAPEFDLRGHVRIDYPDLGAVESQ